MSAPSPSAHQPDRANRWIEPKAKKDRSGSSSLSVVVPCFNEEEVIAQTHARLTSVLEGLGLEYEILYVNDGSSDGTLEILRRIGGRDPRVRVLSLSRNFGHQIAITAGCDQVRSDVTVLIDADLQDPPELIGEMVRRWREGYDVVYGRRTHRSGESRFKLWTAAAFYRTINRLSDVEVPLDVGDFRLMDRQVLEAVRRMPERDRFVRGMVAWAGFRQCALDYERQPRMAGESKYPLHKMLRFAMDGILSFSLVPLKIAMNLGLVASGLAVVGILYALVMRLFTQIWVSGWTLLFIGVLFMGGVQLIFLGVIGEYVGRTYMEVKRRPLYFLEETALIPPETSKPGQPEPAPPGQMVHAG